MGPYKSVSACYQNIFPAESGGAIQDAITHTFNLAEWLVGPITRIAVNADLLALEGVSVEDPVHGRKLKETFDMVLAAGMVPSTKNNPFALPLSYTPEGFVIPELLPEGVFAVASMKSPLDVMKSNEDATGAALKSLISLSRR